jgi:2-oxoglutarate ferredoxin oxidoreductase subunit beta
MEIEKKVPHFVDNPSNFCPGCGHGIVSRLVAECLEELGQDKNMIYTIGIGCSSNMSAGMKADRLHCCHGRASAVATGMKRVNPHNVVISYQGDGDAYSIGMGESIGTAYRNEKITMITINNTTYGMTGGQMGVTTMEGQKTTTTVHGRDCSITGSPFKFPELVASQFDIAYAARGSVDSVANIMKLKGYIKDALEAQIAGEGYSVVEALIPCPTNWGMTPLESIEHIRNVVIPYFTLGVKKARGGA